MSRAIALHLREQGRQLGVLRYDQQGARESSAFQYDASQRLIASPSNPVCRW